MLSNIMQKTGALIAFILITLNIRATHIVSGSLTYEHLGGATYRITFKFYRDCGPGNANFPGSVTIQVRGLNGATFNPSKNITIPLTTTQILDPPIDTCAYNPGVCVEEAIYTKIVNNLPPNNGGYHLYYTYCCRNWSIVNLTNPGSQGDAFYTYIPDNNIYLTNSSPTWKNFPPVFICQGQPLVYDHGAIDADGDSLVYSFYNPYDDNAPTWSGNTPVFTPVTYAAGYNANNPLGPGAITINPQTGVITGVPPTLGQFVVGVKCEEYRNGVKIGEILRDFQFNVLNCPPIPQAAICPVNACAGMAVQFNNCSTPINNNSFYWDFGDPNTTTDNSTQVNPTYTYPSLGTYTVMLIAQYGTPCADTVYQTITLSYVNADYSYNDSVCVNTPVTFTDNSTSSPNSTVTGWYWDFGDGNTSLNQNPTYAYNTGGTYQVMLVAQNNQGCTDTIYKTMYVQSMPVANAGADTFACISNPTINLNGSVLNAGGGTWIGSGTFSPNSSTLNAAYTPTSTQLSNGFAQLILTTTQNGLCPADFDTLIIQYTNGVSVDAGNDIYVCKDTSGVQLNGTVVTAYGGQWSTSGNGIFYPNSFDLNATYIPGSQDTAAGQVTIILTSVGNGNCAADYDTIQIYFSDPPVAYITTNDTACAGDQFIALNAYSTTGDGYWQTLGDGYFTPSDTGLNVFYVAGSNDNNNGQVTLIFQSLNNGGCKTQIDTIKIILIPPPNADFIFTEACPGDTLTFNDASQSFSPLVSWQWNFGDNSSAMGPNTTHVYSTEGYYNVSLVVNSANGCSDTVTKSVQVYPKPVANFTVDGVCVHVESHLMDSTTIAAGSVVAWYWNLGDGNSSTQQNPVHTYGQDTAYQITLIVTSDKGCKDTVTKTVSIQPPPVADFNFTPLSVQIGQDMNFTDLSYDELYSWYWTFGDGNSSQNQNTSHQWTSTGYFDVCLEVTDIYGCKDSICKEIIVNMPPQLPNAFSPNGDGLNDVLYVLGGPFKQLEFKIYNNWGLLIFESNEQKKGWDGTKDGIEQPLGVYVYTIKAVTLDDSQYELKGDVTLLR